jgi:hypothetical protein
MSGSGDDDLELMGRAIGADGGEWNVEHVEKFGILGEGGGWGGAGEK